MHFIAAAARMRSRSHFKSRPEGMEERTCKHHHGRRGEFLLYENCTWRPGSWHVRDIRIEFHECACSTICKRQNSEANKLGPKPPVRVCFQTWEWER